MRGPAAAVLLILMVSVLSGCIGLRPLEPEPEPLLPAHATHDLAPPVLNPTGALGLHVPADAKRLQIVWNLSTAVPGEEDAEDGHAKVAVHEEGPRGVLSHFDGLFMLFGPDGRRLYAGTPSLRLDARPEDTSETSRTLPPYPKGTVHAESPPAPGLYRLVSFGTMPLPRVTLEVPDSETPPPLVPLPVTVTRTTLLAADGAVPPPLVGSGDWETPEGTVAVWGDLHGVGFRGSLDLTTPDGTVVAAVRRNVMSDPTTAGAGQFTFGLDRIGSTVFSDPAALRAPELHWSVEAAGTGIAYAYAAVVGSIPRPHEVTMEDHAADEAVPLEGTLAPQRAGGLLLPEEGRLVVRLASSSSSYRDHASFRVYDASGARLLADAVVDQTPAYVLPTGAIAIVNDGPGHVEVAVAGEAPADATLHPLDRKATVTRTDLGSPLGGPDTAQLRAAYSAPLVAFYIMESGTTDGLYVQVDRADGTPLWSHPEVVVPGYGAPCCPIFVGSYMQPTRWVDPGIHHIQMRTEGGTGEVAVEAVQVDLEGLLALVQDGN